MAVIVDAGPSRTVADLSKRGGSGHGSTITGTVPNHPPSSTDHIHGHKIPKINGSEGGFWGLTFGLALAAFLIGIAGWYLLLRRRRVRQGLPPPQPFAWLTTHRRAAAGGSSVSGQPAGAKRGWAADPSERAWDTLGDDEDDDGFGSLAPGTYGMGGLRSLRRPDEAAMGTYGQGGLSSPGQREGDHRREREGDHRRERFDGPEPEGPTYGDFQTRDTHPYGSGMSSMASDGGQYVRTGAADSTLSLHSAAVSSPPRALYSHFAGPGGDPTASASTIRLVPDPLGQSKVARGPMRDPFADDDEDKTSTLTRDTSDSDDHSDRQHDPRTVRPSHDRGDSTGSRFVEGA